MISFDQPVSLLSKYVASKSKHFPIHRKMVAPFFANINTTTNGGVFFRETEERTLLVRATNDVRRSFAYEKGFQATSLFIATWVKVEYQSKPKDKVSRITNPPLHASYFLLHWSGNFRQECQYSGYTKPRTLLINIEVKAK